MKTIKCGWRCQYMNSPSCFEIQVEDDATEEEIQEQMLQGAIEEASLDCWIEEEPSNVE